ncbi:MAG: hypothetical protein PHZ07_04195 [Patescibacteria group bacterium]|nr:hypothetical protein [Patescibacteria group bacterium]MDD4304771.1 hypothetical protein [Patescibacteria group bacterium]MDD4695490.1 hypothetical protein [Patescibacteria group bacterium]
MNKKQIRILIIVSIIIILLIFFVVLFRDKLNKKLINLNTRNIDNSVPINTNVQKTEEKNENLEMISAKDENLNLNVVSVARNFLERFGSWSTDNKENNFVTAYVYATNDMKNSIKDFSINTEQLKDGYNGYYGVTTKVMNTKLISSDNSSAKVLINFQKIDNSGSVSYGDAELELLKEEDKWLVDSFILK